MELMVLVRSYQKDFSFALALEYIRRFLYCGVRLLGS